MQQSNGYADNNGGISFSGNKPLVPDGKLPPARNGCSIVYVSLRFNLSRQF